MDDALLAAHVEAIHGLPLDEFVAERDRRVKELKAEGHKDEAKALKAQRKPTVPAWAVNQLARQAPDDVEGLLAAADELRTAQHRAASGRGAAGLREASRKVRDLVGDLRHRAGKILSASGTRPEAHLDEAEQTLFAAAVEPEHHDTLRRGVFSSVLPGPGFGGLGVGLTAVPPPSEVADEPDRAHVLDETADGLADAAEQDGESEADRRAEAERRAEEARRAREAEHRAEEERRAERERLLASRRRELTRRIDALEGAIEKQQGRVDRAQQKADDLRERAEAAQVDADATRADLADYEHDLAAARQELADLADD